MRFHTDEDGVVDTTEVCEQPSGRPALLPRCEPVRQASFGHRLRGRLLRLSVVTGLRPGHVEPLRGGAHGPRGGPGLSPRRAGARRDPGRPRHGPPPSWAASRTRPPPRASASSSGPDRCGTNRSVEQVRAHEVSGQRDAAGNPKAWRCIWVPQRRATGERQREVHAPGPVGQAELELRRSRRRSSGHRRRGTARLLGSRTDQEPADGRTRSARGRPRSPPSRGYRGAGAGARRHEEPHVPAGAGDRGVHVLGREGQTRAGAVEGKGPHAPLGVDPQHGPEGSISSMKTSASEPLPQVANAARRSSPENWTAPRGSASHWEGQGSWPPWGTGRAGRRSPARGAAAGVVPPADGSEGPIAREAEARGQSVAPPVTVPVET